MELAERHFSTTFHGLAKSGFVKLFRKIPNEEMGPPQRDRHKNNQQNRQGVALKPLAR